MEPNPLLEQMVLNEVYFGKTDSILAIERQLDVFRKKYIGTKNKPVNDPDLIKLNRMIEEQFGFGCFALMVTFDPIPNAATMPIDYSFNFAKKQNNYLVDETTYKFKKELDYTCIIVMTTGLIFNKYFTTEEVMACLLHELGCNFYSCFTDFNGILSNIYNATLIANMVSTVVSDFKLAKAMTNAMSKENSKAVRDALLKMIDTEPGFAGMRSTPEGRAKLDDMVNDAINNPPIGQKVANAIPGAVMMYGPIEQIFTQSKAYRNLQNNLKNAYHNHKPTKQVVYGFGDILSLISKNILMRSKFIAIIIIKLKTLGLKVNIKNIIKCIDIVDIIVPFKTFITKVKTPLTWITLGVGYRVEKAADNFATMYGYGPAQISYFTKIESKDKVTIIRHFLKKAPAVGILVDMVLAPSKILNGVFDTSPTGISSSYDQLKMLEYELNKEYLDPKMRSIIEQDITLCKNNIQKLINTSNGVEDPDILHHLYNRAMSDYLEGVGLKDVILDDHKKFEKYDKNYKEKLNKKEDSSDNG